MNIIADVKIVNFGSVKALVSVTIEDFIEIHGFRVIDDKDGLSVMMPHKSIHTIHGPESFYLVSFGDGATMDEFKKRILKAYEEQLRIEMTS